MNINSLSQELNISVKELRQKIAEAGFKVSPRARKIDNVLAKQILDKLTPKDEKQAVSAEPAAPGVVKVGSTISVRDFAQALQTPVTVVIKSLIQNGVMASMNEQIDFETAAVVGADLGFEIVEDSETTGAVGSVAEVLSGEQEGDLQLRPPIVAVMGHVDHGKTKLLDTVRKTNVIDTEAGAITQHIGAYRVSYKEKKITFLDTPGHESFAAMRARGANVTDIIILVVAADDGVKPQTLEVINRAKITKTPMIVAINKIDKPDANPDLVKKQLAESGVMPEEWGGKNIFVEISAKQNLGVDKLLDMILLTAEVEGFKANPAGKTVATVIESVLSKTQGAIATVLVQNGALKVGDIVAVGQASGRIRSLQDEHGKSLKSALPSTPVRITGLSNTPEVGDILQVFQDSQDAVASAEKERRAKSAKRLAYKTGISADVENQQLNLVIKVDTQGSLEAIQQEIHKLENQDVIIKIVSQGIGDINESDVLSAESSKATVIGFHNKIIPAAARLAKQKAVNIDIYQIIYELTEDLTKAILHLVLPEVEYVNVGVAKILAVFATEKNFIIAGGRVKEGKLVTDRKVQIFREDKQVGTGKVSELQKNKSTAREVESGSEFGIKISTSYKLQKGDEIRIVDEKIKEKKIRPTNSK